MSTTTRRLDTISSCPEAKGLPSCSSCESSSPEVERFKVAILGVAVGNYVKMHYSDTGWYIGSIKDYLGLPKVRERICFEEVVCVCVRVYSEEVVYYNHFMAKVIRY